MMISIVAGSCVLRCLLTATRLRSVLYSGTVDDRLRLRIRLLQHLWFVFVEKEVSPAIRASAQGMFL